MSKKLSARKNILLLTLVLLLLIMPGCSPEAGRNNLEMLPFAGDVIIVGSGIAGLTAALEASSHGAAVILCYGELPDESWMWNDGFLTAQDDDKNSEELEQSLRAFGKGRGKSWHYKLLARRAGEDVEWLIRETGLSLLPVEKFRSVPEKFSFGRLQRSLMEKALDRGYVLWGALFSKS